MTGLEVPGRGPVPRVAAGGATHPGTLRLRNEDAFGLERPAFFVVCDGMGGEPDGDVAARTAVAATRAAWGSRLDVVGPGESLGARLLWAVETANIAVLDRGGTMATTIVALALEDDRGAIAWAGDSRCGRVRDARFDWLTEDHSVPGDERRKAAAEGRAPSPMWGMLHVVTRALGRAGVEIEAVEFEVRSYDAFVLCSDGLWGAFESVPGGSAGDSVWQIRNHLRLHDDPQDAAEALVSSAVAVDGSDNATAIVVRMGAFG